MSIRQCSQWDHFQQLLQNSFTKPVFLFKHSTACGISAGAWSTFQKFAENQSQAEYWKVLVIEDRPLSLKIADEIGVPHKSPQVILFYKGQPVWHTSHWSIRQKKLAKALEQLVPHNQSVAD